MQGEEEIPTKIVFVYNADSGLLNALKDSAEKLVSPEKYGCNLCSLTYGVIGVKQEWMNFITQLELPIEFLHKDEFTDRYGSRDAAFPSAFTEKRGNLELLISSDEIDQTKTLPELIQLVKLKIKRIEN